MPLLPAFPTRRREPELMDRPGLDPEAHRQALAGLARINAVTDSAGLLWPAVLDAARANPGRPVRVLDVASGAGDVALGLWTKARRAGVPAEVAGCDISPTAVAVAAERADGAGGAVRFFVHDALSSPLPDGYDVITTSLFLHHLDDADAVRLLREMGRAVGTVAVVNDLARGPVNLALVWLACRLLSRSPVVHADGPLSVRAAFTPAELRARAEEAGLFGATVTPKFPCRMLLVWRKAA